MIIKFTLLLQNNSASHNESAKRPANILYITCHDKVRKHMQLELFFLWGKYKSEEFLCGQKQASQKETKKFFNWFNSRFSYGIPTNFSPEKCVFGTGKNILFSIRTLIRLEIVRVNHAADFGTDLQANLVVCPIFTIIFFKISRIAKSAKQWRGKLHFSDTKSIIDIFFRTFRETVDCSITVYVIVVLIARNINDDARTGERTNGRTKEKTNGTNGFKRW